MISPPKTDPVGKLFSEHGIYSFVSIEIGRLYYSFLTISAFVILWAFTYWNFLL